ncbi:mCG145266, partial [Mus musculus]
QAEKGGARLLARVETSGPQADTKKQAAAGLSGYRDMTEHRHFELCIGQTLEAPSQRVHTTRGITRLPSPLLQQVQTVANHPAHGDLWLHLASLCSTLSQTTYQVLQLRQQQRINPLSKG